MGWFDEQIRLRKQNDQEILEDSCMDMAGAVMGSEFRASLESDRVKTKNAIDAILHAMHAKSREIPDDVTELTEQLDYLLDPIGIMRRTVYLPPGWYKELADRCQYFLAYTAIADVAMKASYKITNFGVAKSNDENLQVATMDEIVANQGYYQAKADAECYRLQTWLLRYRAEFPELDACACERIKSNLASAASCGIWLGGPRGREVRR